ncbi:hypothetical protein ACFV2V_25235 [Streptomyces sp. NPDC059698]|uniref:hypothetical protein n=1 Tax=unclassified Streptomyces TaxID=2593676 RepID=UPI001160E8AF|nr:hypothetical protein [Streptomyces sp. CB02366]
MTTRWRRFTDRLAGKTEPEVLFEGLPDHLQVPVRRWVGDVGRQFDVVEEICLRLRLPSTVLSSDRPLFALTQVQSEDEMLFIEIVDAALAILFREDPSPHKLGAFMRSRLGAVLIMGGSAYTITPDGDGLCLRVEETLRRTLDEAIQAAEELQKDAGAHLREAFVAAYGIKPDPSVAYSQAVKAVEAVANPVFLPKELEPTLGKVRSTLDQGRKKYVMAVSDRAGAPAGIDAAVELLNLLWHGQRDRHAGGPTSAPVSQEAAETAVHAAALLVHWVSKGYVRKK